MRDIGSVVTAGNHALRDDLLRQAVDLAAQRGDARAEVIQLQGAGLELRYTRNDKSFVRRMFTDGADLLRAAAVERFELERDGWSPSPRANAPTRQIQT